MDNFKELQVGQWIKVKGAPENGVFSAHEIKIKSAGDVSVMEGKLQGVDSEKNSVTMMSREIELPENVDVKNADREPVSLGDLKVGEIAKLKGAFNEADGFNAFKVKLQEPKGVDLEELQGFIDRMDEGEKTLSVLGLNVKITDETEIEGF